MRDEGPREVYTHGHSTVVVAAHARRTAEREGAFFLPNISPGMQVLDVGCGPGTITAGLARAAHAGRVTGVDGDSRVIDDARAFAESRGIANVEFHVADAYRLPFPDRSFDAVFAHALLEHLASPAEALTEMRRVARPRAVIGVRDVDWGSLVTWPDDAQVTEAASLYAGLWRQNGGDPDCGRKLRGLLRQGAWEAAASSAGFNWDGSRAATRDFARFLARRLLLPPVIDGLARSGLCQASALPGLAQACEAWARRPDAIALMTMCEVVGHAA